MALLLEFGELLAGVAVHTGRGCTAVGFTVSIITVEEEIIVECASLVQEAGVGVLVVWLSWVRAAKEEVSSGPGVMEAEEGGGPGAFLFLCWLSEPRPI